MPAEICGRICSIDGNGDIIHVELETPDGENVEGIYELIGWTRPPKDVKARTEQHLWVPPRPGRGTA